ncbi:hypothetical protein [Shewanella sp. GXUN23E]|uniref:hypothetical protein n=1 Tax=Shewanella sp. GXUN23E TaxID=3422498 RepID=UPI003D7C88B9
MKKLIAALLPLVLVTPGIAYSAQPGQTLGTCMSDSLNGKERKELAKWVYFAMSTHSSIEPYSKVSDKDREASNRYVGALISRLLTEDCPEVAKQAYESDGLQAFETGFGIVGEVAMQELMNEASVAQALGAFEQYLDQSQFDKIFN